MKATKNYRWEDTDHKVAVRDTQRQKLYNAERKAFGEDFTRILGDGSMAAVEEFVRRVESSETWLLLLAKSNRKPINGGLQLKDGRRNRSASANAGELTLPRWARTAPVILHEMAHSATPGAQHNWPFAAAFLALVGRFLGAEVRDKLKAAFKAGKVRYTPPRKMSPEHFAKLRAQGFKLAAARTAPKPELGELTVDLIKEGTVLFQVIREKSDLPFGVRRKVVKAVPRTVAWSKDVPVVSFKDSWTASKFDVTRMFLSEVRALERAAQLNRERAQQLLAAAEHQEIIAKAARGVSVRDSGSPS